MTTKQAHRRQSAKLREIEARRDAALAERALIEVTAIENLVARERNMAASESLSLMGSVFVDRRDYLPVGWGFDAARQFGTSIFSSTSDRQDGRNRPFVEQEFDAATIRGLARLVCGTSCPGIGVVENLQNYVVGNGFVFKPVARRKGAASPLLLDAVEDFLSDFLEANRFDGDLDRELFLRSRRDGEVFVGLYPQEDGVSLLREIEPDQVRDPGAPFDADFLFSRGVIDPAESSYSFGIHTPAGDVQKVLGYSVQWDGATAADYLPAKFVCHSKVNVDRNVKRGVSDFYPAWQWLKQQERVLRNTGEGAAELAAISYIIQFATASKEQVTSMVADKATSVWNSTGASGNSQTHYKHQREPGTQLNVPKGQEYLPGPMGAERGQSFLEVVQGILRQVATRWCMTEGMISGDDSNNNLASSVEAGSRFWSYARSSQWRLGNAFLEILWKALQLAFERGRFRRFGLTWPEFKRAIKLTFEPPQIEQRDPKALEEVRQIRFQNGIISREQWQREAGYEPEEQDAQGAAVQLPSGPATPVEPGSNGTPAGGPSTSAAPTSEYIGLTRQQWVRNGKAIGDVLDGFAAGDKSEARARVELGALGLSAANVDLLIKDATDGKVETLPAVESLAVMESRAPARLGTWLDRAAAFLGLGK